MTAPCIPNCVFKLAYKANENRHGRGVEVIGYLTWGSTDLISSGGQFEKRYGFIFVNRGETDLRDLKRYKKKSFDWYKKVIATNGEILDYQPAVSLK